MSRFAIVTMVVKDAAKLAEYYAVGGQAVAKHSGKIVAGGPDANALQEPHGPTKGVILEFPTAEHITAWLNDPELVDVHALREEAADVTILSLPPKA